MANSSSLGEMALCVSAATTGIKAFQSVSSSAAISSNRGDFLALLKSLRPVIAFVDIASTSNAFETDSTQKRVIVPSGRIEWVGCCYHDVND